jgi:hypothetical protein
VTTAAIINSMSSVNSAAVRRYMIAYVVCGLMSGLLACEDGLLAWLWSPPCKLQRRHVIFEEQTACAPTKERPSPMGYMTNVEAASDV